MSFGLKCTMANWSNFFLCGFQRKPKAPELSEVSRLLENMLYVGENGGEAAEIERPRSAPFSPVLL